MWFQNIESTFRLKREFALTVTFNIGTKWRTNFISMLYMSFMIWYLWMNCYLTIHRAHIKYVMNHVVQKIQYIYNFKNILFQTFSTPLKPYKNFANGNKIVNTCTAVENVFLSSTYS